MPDTWSLIHLVRRTREDVFTVLLLIGEFFLFLLIMVTMLQLTHSVIFTQEYLSWALCLVCGVGLEGIMSLPTMDSTLWGSQVGQAVERREEDTSRPGVTPASSHGVPSSGSWFRARSFLSCSRLRPDSSFLKSQFFSSP